MFGQELLGGKANLLVDVMLEHFLSVHIVKGSYPNTVLLMRQWEEYRLNEICQAMTC